MTSITRHRILLVCVDGLISPCVEADLLVLALELLEHAFFVSGPRTVFNNRNANGRELKITSTMCHWISLVVFHYNRLDKRIDPTCLIEVPFKVWDFIDGMTVVTTK